MTTDYLQEHKYWEERFAQLGQEMPEAMSGFARLHRKPKELLDD